MILSGGFVSLRRLMRAVSRDVGSAPVEFVLVAPLVIILAMAVIQIGIFLHVRSTLVSAAAAGARLAAVKGGTLSEAEGQTTRTVESAIGGSVLRTVAGGYISSSAGRMSVMRVTAVMPLIGFLGPESLTVEAHALREP